jgi:hypothetical protein
MSQPAESAVQALLRLCIMLGVLVVGGMAYHLYGPPVGEASALLDRMVTTAREFMASNSTASQSPAAIPAPPRTAMALAELRPLSPGPTYDPMVSATSSMAPLAALPVQLAPMRGKNMAEHALSPALEALMRQLQSLGAEQFHLAPWGSDGAMHRFECSAPLPGASGFVRHFDAIESDAQLAVSRVLRDVQQWRAQLASQSR